MEGVIDVVDVVGGVDDVVVDVMTAVGTGLGAGIAWEASGVIFG